MRTPTRAAITSGRGRLPPRCRPHRHAVYEHGLVFTAATAPVSRPGDSPFALRRYFRHDEKSPGRMFAVDGALWLWILRCPTFATRWPSFDDSPSFELHPRLNGP